MPSRIETGSVTTGFKASRPLVAFSCGDMEVFIDPGQPGRFSDLLGMVDEYAAQNRCQPEPGPTYQCLDVESDSIDCVE